MTQRQNVLSKPASVLWPVAVNLSGMPQAVENTHWMIPSRSS